MKDQPNEFSKNQNNLKNITIVLLTIAILAMALFTTFLFVQKNEKNTNNPLITTIGEGEVRVKSDQALLVIIVKASSLTPDDAKNITDEKSKTLTAELEKIGIGQKNVTYLDYKSIPRYSQGDVKVIGYETFQSLIVKVNKIDVLKNLEEISSRLNLEIASRSFSISDDSKFKYEARELAIQNSKNKAEEIAKSIGVKLDKVAKFEEGFDAPLPYATQGYANNDGNFLAGDRAIKSKIIITYSTISN